MKHSVKVIEFNNKYTQQVKDLVNLVLKYVGIKPDTAQVYREADLDRILEVYKDRSRFWIALDDDKVIGTDAIAEVDADTAKLRRMFVLPEFHGSGVGKMLLDRALKFARENGYKKVILSTDKLMQRAHRFYEKNGFIKTDENKDKLFYSLTIN